VLPRNADVGSALDIELKCGVRRSVMAEREEEDGMGIDSS